VSCEFRVVFTVCQNGVKIQQNADQHPSEIDSKSMKIWSQGFLGAFLDAVASRIVPGRSPAFPGNPFGTSLAEKVVQRLPFRKSRKSKMAPKSTGGGKIGTRTL
jgi:hypothetical protein